MTTLLHALAIAWPGAALSMPPTGARMTIDFVIAAGLVFGLARLAERRERERRAERDAKLVRFPSRGAAGSRLPAR